MNEAPALHSDARAPGLLLGEDVHIGAGVAFGGFPDKSIFWLQLAYKY